MVPRESARVHIQRAAYVLGAVAFIGVAAADAQSQRVEVVSDTLLVQGAVGPSWIEWDSPALPNADLVYVHRDEWDVRVMDEYGGNQGSLMRRDDNLLGVNFPLDEDGLGPDIHWKGDPEALPQAPIIFFKAENEHSEHLPRNSPSIGWNNDIWAVNVETRQFSRLTQQPAGWGVQHSAISTDGVWYVYPERYYFGNPPWNFGHARMVFAHIVIDEGGNASLDRRFAIEPNGPMYYEPIDIRANEDGSYSLLYVANDGPRMDAYRYDWTPGGSEASGRNTRLTRTPFLHEEFTTFSASGNSIIFMRGPQFGLKYQADLYLSDPDLRNEQRLTWYNQEEDGGRPEPGFGAQLSRLDTNPEGNVIFYGLWRHGGPLRPFANSELRRLEIAPAMP